jgi:TonB family protein
MKLKITLILFSFGFVQCAICQSTIPFKIAKKWLKAPIYQDFDAIPYNSLTNQQGLGFAYTSQKDLAYTYDMFLDETTSYSGFIKLLKNNNLSEVFFCVLGEPMLHIKYHPNGKLQKVEWINFKLIEDMLSSNIAVSTWLDSIPKTNFINNESERLFLKKRMLADLFIQNGKVSDKPILFSACIEYGSDGELYAENSCVLNPSSWEISEDRINSWLSEQGDGLLTSLFQNNIPEHIFTLNRHTFYGQNLIRSMASTEHSIGNQSIAFKYKSFHSNGKKHIYFSSTEDTYKFEEYDTNGIMGCTAVKNSESYMNGSLCPPDIIRWMKFDRLDHLEHTKKLSDYLINNKMISIKILECDALCCDFIATVDDLGIYPQFPGGDTARTTYFDKNFRYPQVALENNIQGIVYLKFVVKSDGSISQVQIERGIPGCPECDQEAIRLVQGMPSWKPGKINGINVSSVYPFRITFELK